MSVDNEITELNGFYTGLRKIASNDTGWVVEGEIYFEASYQEYESITDRFIIRIDIPTCYPDRLPVVSELIGKIDSDYQHIDDTGKFCLGAPFEIRRKYLKQPSLLGFVDNVVVPYLYAYCYFKKHDVMPFGELSHCGEGILEYYQELFQLDSAVKIINCLRSLQEYGYTAHKLCPCGSGKRTRKCHKHIFKEICEYHNANELLDELILMVKFHTGK